MSETRIGTPPNDVTYVSSTQQPVRAQLAFRQAAGLSASQQKANKLRAHREGLAARNVARRAAAQAAAAQAAAKLCLECESEDDTLETPANVQGGATGGGSRSTQAHDAQSFSQSVGGKEKRVRNPPIRFDPRVTLALDFERDSGHRKVVRSWFKDVSDPKADKPRKSRNFIAGTELVTEMAEFLQKPCAYNSSKCKGVRSLDRMEDRGLQTTLIVQVRGVRYLHRDAVHKERGHGQARQKARGGEREGCVVNARVGESFFYSG
jgi:hypothetical protein